MGGMVATVMVPVQHVQDRQDVNKIFQNLNEKCEKLTFNEAKIIEELNAVQGSACDINGYYFADEALAAAAMKPSKILNDALASITVKA